MTAHDLSPRRTPLYETHRRLGAAMTDFAGWTMPLRYGSETAELPFYRRSRVPSSHQGR